MTTMSTMTKPKLWGSSHKEMEKVLDMEKSVFNQLESVELKKGEARRLFTVWAGDRTADMHNFSLMLQDNFKDQRGNYQNYFERYNEFVNNVRKALEQEKFLDPLRKDLQRHQKRVNKTDKAYRKTTMKADRAMTKRNWAMNERKYTKKVSMAQLRKSESEILRDTSQRTYDTERDRIETNIRDLILEGYMLMYKENYYLHRAEIVQCERLFDRFREEFPDHSDKVDVPREKLTPILSITKDEEDRLRREMEERERAKQPRFSIQQAMEAALPGMSGPGPVRGAEGAGVGEREAEGGRPSIHERAAKGTAEGAGVGMGMGLAERRMRESGERAEARDQPRLEESGFGTAAQPEEHGEARASEGMGQGMGMGGMTPRAQAREGPSYGGHFKRPDFYVTESNAPAETGAPNPPPLPSDKDLNEVQRRRAQRGITA